MMNQFELPSFPNIFNKNFHFDDNESFSDEDESIQIFVPQTTFCPLEWKVIQSQLHKNLHSFCPYCGQFVNQISDFLGCKLQDSQKLFLAHSKCASQKNRNIEEKGLRVSTYRVQKDKLQFPRQNKTLGGKQYSVQVCISHPLSSYNYVKYQKKVTLQDNVIFLPIHSKSSQILSFQPNMIVIPLNHFDVQLKLKSIGLLSLQQNIRLNVDLSQIFVGKQFGTDQGKICGIIFDDNRTWTLHMELQIIVSQAQKLQIVQLMNYKLKIQTAQQFPLIKLTKIFLVQKNGFEQKLLTVKIQNGTKDASSTNTLSDRSVELVNPESMFSSFNSNESFNMSYSDLRNYSKTQSGSKELQKNIKAMTSQDIDYFIYQISEYLYELLQDDYANYMVQALISACNQNQRIVLLRYLQPNLTHVVCSKQGTFACQQIISYLKTKEQYELISNHLQKNFIEISTDNNGNHFLRKILQLLPFEYIMIISKQIFVPFLDLINNRNSVCVLKVLLKAVVKQTIFVQQAKQVRKKIIDILTLNTETVIKNQFGNYFIQEAYEVFGTKLLKGISDFILNKFKKLAKQKFSSSVLCKCVNTYWKDTQYYQCLKTKLSSSDILDLFRNRQGNKILLEIMNLQDQFSIKNKIASSISNDFPSKFNTSKWTGFTGSRTGTVGTKFSGFSDAAMQRSEGSKLMAANRTGAVGTKFSSFCDGTMDRSEGSKAMTKKKYYNIQ